MYFPRAISSGVAACPGAPAAPRAAPTIDRATPQALAMFSGRRPTRASTPRSSSMFPPRPGRDGGGQAGFHDEGILPRVVVIATATAHDAKAEGLVEGASLDVGGPHLEADHRQGSPGGVVEDCGK